MCNNVPNFHKNIQPLSQIFEAACKQAGKKKFSARRNMSLRQLTWCTGHKLEIGSVQDSLGNAARLAFHSCDQALWAYTDAS